MPNVYLLLSRTDTLFARAVWAAGQWPPDRLHNQTETTQPAMVQKPWRAVFIMWADQTRNAPSSARKVSWAVFSETP